LLHLSLWYFVALYQSSADYRRSSTTKSVIFSGISVESMQPVGAKSKQKFAAICSLCSGCAGPIGVDVANSLEVEACASVSWMDTTHTLEL
jgi:hypothetical protein